MSLLVGIQSVIFYGLSCGPCSKVYHRQHSKKVAKRERAEKHALEAEQPGLYRHPSPFSTNPYWDEEIMLGPGGPKRKPGSKNTSSRAVNGTVNGTAVQPQGSSVTSSGMSTDLGSSPTMVDPEQRLSGDDWNRKRYQREDEELWGIDTNRASQRIREAIAKAESSVGSTFRMIEGRLSKVGYASREEERSPYSVVARNPPVNDLHPPIVSSQSSMTETRWMLQPPPPAKVMEGKEKANRSRSGSRGSSRLGVDGTNLSRQVTGRAVEERLRRGENPSDLELRPLSSRPDSRQKNPGSWTPKSQPLSRGRSHSMDSSGSSDAGGCRRKRKPPPSNLAVDEASSDYTAEHVPIHSDDNTPTPSRPASSRDIPRPKLSTIASSSEAVPTTTILSESKNSQPGPRQLLPSPNLDRDGPLPLKVPSASDLNAMPVLLPAVSSKFPGGETYKFPPRSSQEENIRSPLESIRSTS
jgi:hypothetical protein